MIVLFAYILACIHAEKPKDTSISPVLVGDVISQLTNELEKIENTYIPLESGSTIESKFVNAVVELAQIRVNTGGGKFKVGVPQYGVGLEAGVGSSVSILEKYTITLGPPPEIKHLLPPQLSQIANSIIAMKKELLSSASENPKFQPRELKLEKEFGVKQEVKGGGGIKILFIEIEGSGGRESSFTNKITINYKVNISTR